MKKHSEAFFTTDGFWSSLFLDPRFKFSSDDGTFNLNRQNQALDHILKVHQKMLNKQTDLPPNKVENADEDDVPIEYKILQQRTGSGQRTPSSIGHKDSDLIHKKLMRFSLEPKVKIKPGEKFNVLDFWQKLVDHVEYKEISEIAAIILSVSASQSTLSDEFIAFSHAIYHLPEGKISENEIQNYFMVKMNLDMIECVNFP